MRAVLSFIVITFGLGVAHADFGPAWTCSLSGAVSGSSWHFGPFGEASFSGPAELVCHNVDGFSAKLDVTLDYNAWAPGLGETESTSLGAFAAGFGLIAPEAIFGTYKAVSAGATAFGHGHSVDLLLRKDDGALAFELGFRCEDEVGLALAGAVGDFTISPAGQEAEQ